MRSYGQNAECSLTITILYLKFKFTQQFWKMHHSALANCDGKYTRIWLRVGYVLEDLLQAQIFQFTS